jgi:hypothetical protein
MATAAEASDDSDIALISSTINFAGPNTRAVHDPKLKVDYGGLTSMSTIIYVPLGSKG